MIIHNPILTGSFTVNGTDVSSITSSAASLTSLNAYTASQNDRNGTYATTGSNTFAGIQTINSNLTVTGSITAQTLVVQTVTSSVVYSSGSNVFGNNIANTQVFTGSMNLTGSLTVVTTGTEFQVTNTGVKFGNVIGDAHSITGSVGISGSLTGVGATFSGDVGIGTTSPQRQLTINSSFPALQFTNPTTGTTSNDGLLIFQSGLNGTISNQESGSLSFETNNTFRAIITSGGNVGIGTSSPNDKFVIDGGNNIWTGVFRGTSTSSQSYGVQIFGGSNSSDTAFRILNGATTSTYMLVRGDGNVGIGTGSPVSFGSTNTVLSVNNVNGGGGGGVFVCMSDGNQGIRMAVDSAGSALWEPRNVFLQFATNNAQRMRIAANGDITLGVTSAYDTAIIWRSDFTGGIHGRIYATGAPRIVVIAGESNGVQLTSGATSWTSNSDETLKNINGVIENAVDKINTLRAVNFSWKSDENKKEVLGLIAQDVEVVFPQIVDTDEDNIKGVRYTEMIPVLVKAIQELQAQITELKNK